MITLEYEMTYKLGVVGPLESEDGSPASTRRQWWQMAEATLVGPRITASAPLPGIDWFAPLGDGFGRPHVKLPFRTDDGALILLDYTGIVQATPAFEYAVEHDHSTKWEDQYMRMALLFETTSERYKWLAQNLFIARGRLLAAKQIEYDVYRVG